jgi:hypothetical protein
MPAHGDDDDAVRSMLRTGKTTKLRLNWLFSRGRINDLMIGVTDATAEKATIVIRLAGRRQPYGSEATNFPAPFPGQLTE